MELETKQVFFYKCCWCRKETFSDINNKKEQRLCLDCKEQKIIEAYHLLKVGLGTGFYDLKNSPYANVMFEFEKKIFNNEGL